MVVGAVQAKVQPAPVTVAQPQQIVVQQQQQQPQVWYCCGCLLSFHFPAWAFELRCLFSLFSPLESRECVFLTSECGVWKHVAFLHRDWDAHIHTARTCIYTQGPMHPHAYQYVQCTCHYDLTSTHSAHMDLHPQAHSLNHTHSFVSS